MVPEPQPGRPGQNAALPSAAPARLGCSMATDSPTVDGRTVVEPDGGTMAELYTRYVPAGIRLAYLLTGDRTQGRGPRARSVRSMRRPVPTPSSAHGVRRLHAASHREPAHVGTATPQDRA